MKMICRNFLILIIVNLAINITVHGELITLLGPDGFENSLKYGAGVYRIDNIDASEVVSGNGIVFSGEDESSVRMRKSSDFLGFGGMVEGAGYIEHEPSGDSSAGEGLVIRFKYPVRKFGISIGALLNLHDPSSGGPGVASLRTYSAGGQLAGTVEVEETNVGYDDFQLPYSIFGFETAGGPGITTIVMDFGESEIPERINSVYYDYTQPRPFKVILPQIAHGCISGASIESDLVLFWDRSTSLKFLSPSGDPVSNSILDEGSEFILTGDKVWNHFKSSTIPGIDDLTVGYVVAESDYPIDGQVVYRTTDSEGKVYEADIRGCVPETYLQIPFELNQAENLNAALAIVNPSDTVAEIEIHVNDAEVAYTEFWDPPVFTLQPGEQRALFMWELWNQMPSEDGNYILQLRSAVPFAAAAFYTRNWIVVGNLPVWSYQEGQAR